MATTSYKKLPYEYGFSSPEISVFKTKQGINPDVVKTISLLKHEDDKMYNFRLRAFQYFSDQPMPTWGPDLSDINFDDIFYTSHELRKLKIQTILKKER
jgi:Fe-S cluster assembly protein SufB